MDDAVLEELLIDLESDRVERTSSARDTDKVAIAVCAFANDLPDHRRPGVVFIGADDDGSCSGLEITDELLRNLGGLRSDGNILPVPVIAVQKRVIDGCELAVVIVQPSPAPPVRYRGRTWIRVGPRRAMATVDEERRLAEKRRAGDLPFDARPLPSASVDDLDLELFRTTYLPAALAPDVLAGNERSTLDQLSSARFATAEGVPTAAGVLTVGSDPRQLLPGAYVQFLRVSGTDLTDPITDNKELGGPLPLLLRQVEEIVKVNIAVAADLQGPVEASSPDYPTAALWQILHNAVMHRNYEGTNAPVRFTWFSDRVEILSPGGPFGQVGVVNFGQPGVTDYRNPTLAEAMKTLGYVQKFGVGIQLARKELSGNGNPPPEFVVNEAQVLVVVRSRA